MAIESEVTRNARIIIGKTKENKSEEQPEEPSKKNQDIPNLKEVHYGKILELEDLNDAEAIRPLTEKIAQYHPDRVRAMGPEIRDVAEKKAKKVNEAYEYFRKKLKSPK